VTWLVILTQLLSPFSNQLVAGQAGSPSPRAASETTQHVEVNRTVPNVKPPSPFLQFSAQPTDDEILNARVFSSPLLATGPTTPRENRELATAMLAFHHRSDRDDAAPLENFLQAHPASPRRIALLAHLASHYRASCQFSKALPLWQQVWAEGKAISGS